MNRVRLILFIFTSMPLLQLPFACLNPSALTILGQDCVKEGNNTYIIIGLAFGIYTMSDFAIQKMQCINGELNIYILLEIVNIEMYIV